MQRMACIAQQGSQSDAPPPQLHSGTAAPLHTAALQPAGTNDEGSPVKVCWVSSGSQMASVKR